MRCKKCKHDLYEIEIMDCEDCTHNAAWNGEDYTQDTEAISVLELERDRAYQEGYCDLGDTFGEGCYKFTCWNCGAKSNLPLKE